MIKGETSVKVATASFVRPDNTTAYAEQTLIANDTVAGNVVPLEFDLPGLKVGDFIAIRYTELSWSPACDVNSLYLMLFDAPPVVEIGDGGVLFLQKVRLLLPWLTTLDM